MNEPAGRLVAVSMFTEGARSGHLLIDDEAYFAYLVERKADFVFFTSDYSVAQLTKLHPDHASRLRVLPSSSVSAWRRMRAVRLNAGDQVVFFGFSEKAVLVFLAMNALRRFRLTLVATNNFSARRQQRYRTALTGFLHATRRVLARIVVHTDFESKVVASLCPPIANRVLVKKHHLMTRRNIVAPKPDRPTICFFGPVKHDKPVEPLAALIRADTASIFNYRVFNVDPASEALLRKAAAGRPVEFISVWRSYSEYERDFAAASLILLTHNAEFEGKLSGNLCDCVAIGIPFLADRFEPIGSYLREYGIIGYQYDFSDPAWPTAFLTGFDAADYAERRSRMSQVSRDYSMAAIHADLDRCLGLA